MNNNQPNSWGNIPREVINRDHHQGIEEWPQNNNPIVQEGPWSEQMQQMNIQQDRVDARDHISQRVDQTYRIIAVESDEDLVQQQNLAQMQPMPLNIVHEADVHEEIHSTQQALKELAKEAGIQYANKGSQEKSKIFEDWSNQSISTIISRVPEDKRIKILMSILQQIQDQQLDTQPQEKAEENKSESPGMSDGKLHKTLNDIQMLAAKLKSVQILEKQKFERKRDAVSEKKLKVEERMKEAQESIRRLMEAAAGDSSEENEGFNQEIRNELPDMGKTEAKMTEKLESQVRILQQQFTQKTVIVQKSAEQIKALLSQAVMHVQDQKKPSPIKNKRANPFASPVQRQNSNLQANQQVAEAEQSQPQMHPAFAPPSLNFNAQPVEGRASAAGSVFNMGPPPSSRAIQSQSKSSGLENHPVYKMNQD